MCDDVWPAPTGLPMVLAPAPTATATPTDEAISQSGSASSPAIFQVRTWHLIAAGLSSRTIWLAPIAAIGGALQLFGDLGRGEQARDTLREFVTSSGPLIAVLVIATAAVGLAVGSQLVKNFQYRITRHRNEFIIVARPYRNSIGHGASGPDPSRADDSELDSGAARGGIPPDSHC
jgi:hypothetical protein